jgi:hypothetical protein
MILNTPQFPHKKQKFNQFIILEKRHNCKPFFAFSPLFATKKDRQLLFGSWRLL